MSGFIENISVAWTGDFDSLKQFSNEVLKLDGEWTQPGGDKKVFTFGNSVIVWRKNKGILNIDVERSDEIKRRICEVMFKDNGTLLTPPLQSNSSMTTDALMEDMEGLKKGQMLNSEIIQSLAESVSELASAISCLQYNKAKSNSTCSENREKFTTDVEYFDYVNSANTQHLEKLTNLYTDNRNETLLINETGIPDANDSEMLHSTSNNTSQINTHCISLMKDIDDAPGLNDNEMPLITSHESSTDVGRSNTQKSTYAEVVKSPPSLEKNSGIAKSPENAMGKEKPQTKSQEVSAGKLSDGFIGVQRKRRKFKQFFLSGIADDVNESQIISYLAERNIKPNNILIFRSRRKGTISVKIGIPLASVSTVLEENFWPDYVQCKPWQYKENRRNPAAQDIIKTQTGNYSTYV